jgi:hypothetical protein
VTVTQARFCSDLVRRREPGTGVGEPATQEVGHPEPAHRLRPGPGDPGGVGRAQRVQPELVRPRVVTEQPVRPAGQQQRPGAYPLVGTGVGDHLLGQLQRLRRPAQLQLRPALHELVHRRELAGGEPDGALAVPGRLCRLAGGHRPAGQPAQRRHPERGHRAYR